MPSCALDVSQHPWPLSLNTCSTVPTPFPCHLIFFFLRSFILGERMCNCTHECTSWGKGRERGKARIPSKLHAVSMETDGRLDLTNCEIITWAKINSHLTDWATQAPPLALLNGTKKNLQPDPNVPCCGNHSCWELWISTLRSTLMDKA